MIDDCRLETVEALARELAAQGRDYLILTPLPAAFAEVRFLGCIEGRAVVWRLRLATLEQYQVEHGLLPTPPARARGVMDLSKEQPDCWRAQVALAVPVIDEPVVRKTIVMMRNYRALRAGCKVWGD
ncbi:hypothetical protein [Thiobacter aerophilum]|uniref:Uncharacterized protein n=1 Tax=Thiobacter aerophilum TaxID=3121275 RepID=A0ABV0EEK6_9BURK